VLRNQVGHVVQSDVKMAIFYLAVNMVVEDVKTLSKLAGANTN
jgi:hypothetical protein